MHLQSDTVVGKCWACGGVVIHKKGETYCSSCYRIHETPADLKEEQPCKSS